MVTLPTTEAKIRERLDDLIDEADYLRRGGSDGKCLDIHHYQRCLGWIAGAQNIVHLALPDPEALYRKRIDEIAAEEHEFRLNAAVGAIAELLSRLSFDLRDGLLASIEDHARAEVFDDFLDHARSYLDAGMKNEAGVVAGVVFEDALRRICRKRGAAESGRKLDSLISELTKAGVLSGAMAKRARAGAHVRTKATHAQWDEFERGDVEATIALSDELILKHLGS